MKDVVIIGGGPGGYAAAIRASQLGGKVALVEAKQMGGTCVNVGCIPSKIYMRSAYLLHQIRKAQDFGIKASVEGLDFTALTARKNGVAGDIRMGMEGLLKNNAVEVFRGRAVLKNPQEVEVEGVRLEAKKIILATGSSLHIPEIPGLEQAMLTTDQVFELTEPPASILIPGSDHMEVEMASLFSVFGSKVYLAVEEAGILPREDNSMSQRLTQSLKEQGVEILRRFTLKSVEKSSGGYKTILTGQEERTIEVERILICSRKPNSRGLGLEEAGVSINDDGSVRVNERLETTVKGIYAVGDVTGGWMLSHAASAMAVTAAENAMGQTNSFPFNLVPRGIWTFPELGAVGLTEREAKKQGIDVQVGDFPYSVNGLAMARGEMAGAVKIIADARYGEILGVHVVGASATEVIGEAVLAMQLETTAEELARSIRVHPTFSEAMVDSARDALKWALYLPRKR
jgi:dihydrolipoamide dehydrogenase